MSARNTHDPTDAPMPVELRPGTPEDADLAGRICHQAFTAIAAKHGFPSDFPAPEISTGLMTMLLAHPGFYSVVAEREGRIVGSNFLDERSAIAGVVRSRWTRTPGRRGRPAAHAGRPRSRRRARLRRRAAAAVGLPRPVARSLRPAGLPGARRRRMHAGPAIGATIPGYRVRPAAEADREACDRVCRQVHGHDRDGELRDAIGQGSAVVVEHGDRLTGYASATAFFGHAVGETTEDLKALIGAAGEFGGPASSCRSAMRALRVVPGAPAAGHVPDDADERRALQRAGGGLPAVCALLSEAAGRAPASAGGPARFGTARMRGTPSWP